MFIYEILLEYLFLFIYYVCLFFVVFAFQYLLLNRFLFLSSSSLLLFSLSFFSNEARVKPNPCGLTQIVSQVKQTYPHLVQQRLLVSRSQDWRNVQLNLVWCTASQHAMVVRHQRLA